MFPMLISFAFINQLILYNEFYDSLLFIIFILHRKE